MFQFLLHKKNLPLPEPLFLIHSAKSNSQRENTHGKWTSLKKIINCTTINEIIN